MRLPRMTTRRWMIAVLVFGLGMGAMVGGVRLKRRRDSFLARARFHALTEAACRELVRPAPDPSDWPIIEYDVPFEEVEQAKIPLANPEPAG